ncbi:MAG: LamG-like jellyroll fold domain-containing protein [Minisyncoccales bacterium]
MNNKNKSFTLIELLVVIVIIGILAGVIMISTSSSIQKANFAKAQAFSSTVKNSMLPYLISEWTFDEGEGVINSNATNSDVRDGWGNNHGDITSHAPILTNDCINGKCLQFNGANYILVNDDVSTRLSSVTIATWVKLSNYSNLAKFLSKRNDNNFYFLGLSGDGKRPYLGIGSGVYEVVEWDNDISLNSWHFIVGTFNATTQEAVLYVDGLSKNKTMTCSIGNLENRPIIMGGESTSGENKVNFFTGSLDDVRLYGQAISFTEVKKQYIAGLKKMYLSRLISKREYNQRINNISSSNISFRSC